MTQGNEDLAKRWSEHFQKVLNIPSEHREQVIEDILQLPPLLELDSPPTGEELTEALMKLKNGKAGGKIGILPELIHYGGCDLEDRILKIMEQTWEDGYVVDDWKNAVVVPIPKKGDLRRCDNWRGISLLDVVGKVMARIVKERL